MLQLTLDHPVNCAAKGQVADRASLLLGAASTGIVMNGSAALCLDCRLRCK